MDLAQHCDQPAPIRIGGADYLFSELTVESMGAIVARLKTMLVHPIAAIRGQLDGLDEDDRRYLLDQARKDAAEWPPHPGSPAFMVLAAERPDVQVLLFGAGLRQHKPEATDAEVRKMLTAAKQADIQRIIRILFGHDPDMEDDAPKAGAGDTGLRTGTGSSGRSRDTTGSRKRRSGG